MTNSFNSIINLAFKAVSNELGNDLYLISGALIIIQKPHDNFAYAYHIKNQGGGTVGEYHLILNYDSTNTWQSTLGSSIDRESFETTGSEIKGFDMKIAQEIIIELDILWARIISRGLEEDVEHPYDELFLLKKDILLKDLSKQNSHLEKHHGTEWYSKNEIKDKNDILNEIDIESISSIVPGNMCFI